MAYHRIRYMGSTLDLRFPSFKKDDARDANKLCDNESRTAGGKFDNNSTGSEIATSNCERNVLKRDFEAKRNGDEIHDGCVSSLSITGTGGLTSIKSESKKNGDVTMGIGVLSCYSSREIKSLKHDLENCSKSVPFVVMNRQTKSYCDPVNLYTLTLELPKNPQAPLSVKKLCIIYEYVIEQIASHRTAIIHPIQLY